MRDHPAEEPPWWDKRLIATLVHRTYPRYSDTAGRCYPEDGASGPRRPMGTQRELRCEAAEVGEVEEAVVVKLQRMVVSPKRLAEGVSRRRGEDVAVQSHGPGTAPGPGRREEAESFRLGTPWASERAKQS